MFAKTITAALLGTTLLATAAFAQSPAATTDRANMAPTATASETHQGQWRSSKLVGLNVYNDKNESLGDINELLTDAQGKISQVVLGVGGFLGVGERYVAVPFEKIKWVNEPASSNTAMNSRPVGPATTPAAGTSPSTTTGSASTTTTTTTASATNRWYPDHAVYNATKDELKALPEFKYNN